MKKSCILFTILCLAFAAMFSCCFLPVSQAAISVEEAYCSHHEEDSHSKPQASQSGCDCEQIIALTARTLFIEDFIDTGNARIFYDEKNIQIAANNFVLFTDSGPPNSGIPLYIQHSILRI